ncbi:RSC complex subunit Rsc7 [Fusarium beomiforme]|uniref:RSC complex subunit Rsc7 n=1 Tax=Fusarium beomiforme TaxID=44412 RepID=A0A9P5E6Z0_9HYPO|nr:RSC complex subunit Rsc7 [Fusarium beomiforme]
MEDSKPRSNRSSEVPPVNTPNFEQSPEKHSSDKTGSPEMLWHFLEPPDDRMSKFIRADQDWDQDSSPSHKRNLLKHASEPKSKRISKPASYNNLENTIKDASYDYVTMPPTAIAKEGGPASASSVSNAQAQTQLDKSALQQAVLYFGDAIISLMCNESWFESVMLFHSPEFICRRITVALIGLLHSGSESVSVVEESERDRKNSPESISHEFRSQLARYICNEMQKSYRNQGKDNITRQLQVEHAIPLSILRTMQSLGICNQVKSDSGHKVYSVVAYICLFEGSLFSSFSLTLRQNLYDKFSPVLSYIEATILNSFSQGAKALGDGVSPAEVTLGATSSDQNRTVDIVTDWRPWEFLECQFGQQIPPLASIVTYTGFVSSAFAGTCSDYVEMFWPCTGPLFLKVLEKLVKARNTKAEYATIDDKTQKLRLRMSLSADGGVIVKATSSDDNLVQIAQLTVWICSAFRLGPESDTEHTYYNIGYIREVKEISLHSNYRFFQVYNHLRPIKPDQQSCWQEIVAPTAVLCQHFPIPERHDEVGLELPLGIFCAMTSVRHAVEFEGGIVMKSLDSMLVPIQRKNDIVQWHFVRGEDESRRFTYQDGISKCPGRAFIDTVNFETLRSTRAIVGWCRRARKVIGREDATYETIDYSTTKPLSYGLNISGGALGFQQFAAAQLNFTLGPKDTRVVFQRSGAFRKILQFAGRSHIMLHDTEEKRAWLVNADDVILHIIQARLSRNQPSNQLPSLLKYLDTAFKTLEQNEDWKLISSSESVSSMVTEIWSMLEMLLDKSTGLNKTPERSVRMPFQKEIFGFEFMGRMFSLAEDAERRRLLKYNSLHFDGPLHPGWEQGRSSTSYEQWVVLALRKPGIR